MNELSRRVWIDDFEITIQNVLPMVRRRQQSWAIRQLRKNPPPKGISGRDWLYRQNYGITLADYNRMLAEQDRKCAICKRTPSYHLRVDHDHVTNEVRGLLCDNCNQGLGHFKDSPRLLRRAIKYLQEHCK